MHLKGGEACKREWSCMWAAARRSELPDSDPKVDGLVENEQPFFERPTGVMEPSGES